MLALSKEIKTFLFLRHNVPLKYRRVRYQTTKIVALSYQKYRAWSDCTDVQVGLALNWWQRFITFGSSRARVI
jgi:hypothetical protein